MNKVQTPLSEITFDSIYDGVTDILGLPVPKGYFSSSIFLHKTLVSLTGHESCVEMRLIDSSGGILYIGKLARHLPPGFIAGEFYEILRKLLFYFEPVKVEEDI